MMNPGQDQPQEIRRRSAVPRHAPTPQKNFGVRLGAGCLIFFGVTALFGAVGALTNGEMEGFLSASVFAALFAGTGVYWWRWQKGNELKKRTSFDDKIVLDIAASNGGNVTVAQLSLLTSLSVEQAEAALTRLCSQGVARVEMTENGTIVYVFSGLSPFQLD